METKRVKIDGVEIVYNQMGKGPVILYLHGNLGSRIWFEKNMDIEGYTAVAPDLPNFGDSGSIAGHSPEDYGRLMALFIEELVPEGIALIVGHSLGGAAAMETAFRIPDKVAAMLLLDSCPVDGLKTPEAYYPVITQYQTDRELLTKALSSVVPSLDDAVILERLVDQAVKMKKEAFLGHAVELGKVNYEAAAAGFAAPVLVVRGEKDGLITADMAETLAAAFPNGKITSFPDAGHSLMVEKPDKFNKIIQDFLI